MPRYINTAILIFSRSAPEEAVAKRYGCCGRQAVRIAQGLISHTERAAQLSGLHVIRKYSGSQHGATFGDRFANAIDGLFRQGFARVIAIGTDTPGITPGILRRINKELQQRTLVTGPSADGGVYAIGMSREGWDREAFLKVSWQTGMVQDDLRAYSHALDLAQHTLTPLGDLDSGGAFNDWLHHAGAHTLVARRIGAALAIRRWFENESSAVRLAPAFSHEARRGPPVAA